MGDKWVVEVKEVRVRPVVIEGPKTPEEAIRAIEQENKGNWNAEPPRSSFIVPSQGDFVGPWKVKKVEG